MWKIKKVAITTNVLWIPLNQPKAALVAIMLDPRSSTAIFQEPTWQPLLKEKPLALFIMPKGGYFKEVTDE